MTSAQRVAVIVPETEGAIASFKSQLRSSLRKNFRIIDESMANTAFRSVEIINPFNQTTEEARRIAAVVGCEYLIVLRSAIQRREATSRSAYFEAYAYAFVVDGRSGSMIKFVFETREGSDAADAQAKLRDAAASFSTEITTAISQYKPPNAKDANFFDIPADGSTLSKGLRTPVPYKRIRPEYTRQAYLYGIKATVDIEVDIDADGSIPRTSIERWAGFGLDESVEKTVRSMNWRPAERDGKPLPMRVLLRYNFTKIEKDEAN